MQRFEATGDVAPAQFGGFKRSPLLAHEQTLRDWLEKTRDLSIAALCARLAEHGTTTSPAAMSRYLTKWVSLSHTMPLWVASVSCGVWIDDGAI